MGGFINPSIIANSVAKPQVDSNPLSLAEGVARVRQLQQQTALAPVYAQQAQADLQSRQLQNTQAAQEIKDQQSFGQSVAQSGGDPDKLEAALAPITSPKIRLTAEDTVSKLRARIASTTAEQDKVTAARNQQLLSQLQGVREASDPATRAALWQQTASSALAMKDPSGNPVLTAQHLDPNTVPDDTTLQAYETYLDRSGSFLTGVAKRKTDLAKAAQDTVAAKDAELASALKTAPNNDQDWQAWRAGLSPENQVRIPAHYSPSAVAGLMLGQVAPDKQPEYRIKTKEADAMQSMTPQSVEQSIAQVIDPRTHPQEFSEALGKAKVALQYGILTPNALQGYIKDSSDKIASLRERIAGETDPSVLNARIKTAVSTQKALRQGSNPDLANVPPEAVSKVQEAAIKADQEYGKAKAATESLGRILDLAESGNKAAGSNLPLVGVETLNALNGIKRINSSELNQYQGAGSLLDQIKGKLGKVTKGQPIPQDVLDDIRTLHQSLGQQGYDTYTGSLNSINSRTGATLKPTAGPPNIRKPTAGPQQQGGAIAVKAPNGKTYHFNAQDDADKFKKAAGIP